MDDQEAVPQKRRALETAIELVLARRGTDVVQTEFGKLLGGGLYEFRLRWTAEEVRHKVLGVMEDATTSEAILLRVFFCTAGRKLILLLAGYDKGRDPSAKRQDMEVVKARKLLRAHRLAERASRRRP